MDEIKLNPCRECEKAPVVIINEPETTIRCENCGISVCNENEFISATEDWNLLNMTTEQHLHYAVKNILRDLKIEKGTIEVLREALSLPEVQQ